MPRILLACAVLVAGCSFKADYTGGQYRCGDGKCPSGLTCIAGTCGVPADAKVDTPPADSVDARTAALTCMDPYVFPAAGGTAMGKTTMRSNTVSSSCGGFVMNGLDAVYRFDATLGQHIMVTVSGNYPVNAYVIAPCTMQPATPACVGNINASAGNPINVAVPATAAYFVVVDTPNPAQSGDYTLTVTH